MIDKVRTYLKYFIIIIFIKNIISYNEKDYLITPFILKYHRLITFFILFAIIVIGLYNYIPLALVISIILIIYLDKYHNNIEKYTNIIENYYNREDIITMLDVLNYYKHCIRRNWSTPNCQIIKKKLIETCQTKLKVGECPPWDKNSVKANGKKYPLDCPKIYHDLYPNRCKNN